MFRILCPELAGHLGYDTNGEAACVASLAEAEVIAKKESRDGAVLVQIVDDTTDDVVRVIAQTGRPSRETSKESPQGRPGRHRKGKG
jgi:hypothetical protein